MSYQEDSHRLRELERKINKAKHRTMSEHAKDHDPHTAYTYLFEPMGQITQGLNRKGAWMAKCMLVRDPTKREYCIMVAELLIYGDERHASRWQGQDQVLFDEGMTPGRRIIYGEKGEDYDEYKGLDDL
jgi:hypothetical protein